MRLTTDVDRDLPQIHRMRELLSRGIGVHHSGLLPIMKEMVEILFQRGLVKVLFATETFAMGVNMPARSVVFSGLRKNDGQSFRSLLPGEYTQMSGRAGRRGLDATGVVIIVGNDETPDVHGLNRMILGQSTKLKSQFRITYGMVLNLLRVEALKVEEMIKRSFSENATQRMLPEQQRMLRELQNKNAALEPEFRTCALPVDELSALYDCSRKTLSCSNALHAMAFHHSQGNRCFGEGRVVLLREGLGDVVPAIIVRPVTGEHFLVLAAPTVAQKQARSSARLLPMWVTPALAAQLAEPRVPNLREVPLSDILLVTAFTVSISVAAIQSRRQSVLRKALDALSPCMEAIRAHVAAAGARTAVVIAELEVDWSRLRRLDFLEMRKERDALLGELVERQLLMEHEDFVREYVLMHRRKELEKQMAHVSAKLSNENLDLLPDYHQRVDVLKTLRFIDPESETVLLKGRVACEIRSCNELILTELILDNTFTEYAPEEITALLSVFHFREKSAEPELNDTLQSGYRRIIEAADRVAAVQLSHQLPTEDDASTLKTGLVEVVYEWACGKTFNEIMQLTDVGEGTIVRCIMRLDETFREIREASRIIGDMDLLRKMETCQLLVRYVRRTIADSAATLSLLHRSTFSGYRSQHRGPLSITVLRFPHGPYVHMRSSFTGRSDLLGGRFLRRTLLVRAEPFVHWRRGAQARRPRRQRRVGRRRLDPGTRRRRCAPQQPLLGRDELLGRLPTVARVMAFARAWRKLRHRPRRARRDPARRRANIGQPGIVVRTPHNHGSPRRRRLQTRRRRPAAYSRLAWRRFAARGKRARARCQVRQRLHQTVPLALVRQR